MERLDIASWEALSYICAIYVVVQHSALGVDGGYFVDFGFSVYFLCVIVKRNEFEPDRIFEWA